MDEYRVGSVSARNDDRFRGASRLMDGYVDMYYVYRVLTGCCFQMHCIHQCNCLGTMGYVRAFKYFSSVIIAVAALRKFPLYCFSYDRKVD